MSDVDIDTGLFEDPREAPYITAARYRVKAREVWNDADCRRRYLARADQLDGGQRQGRPK